MAIWLKTRPKVLALDTDVVRADELGRLTELHDALEALDETVHATMHEATRRARNLVEAARSEADAFVAAARRKFENSARLGYAAGHRRAVADVHAKLLERARNENQQLQAAADRLVHLVMKSVEQVVAETDRDALMRRVGLAVARSIGDAAHLSVTVGPGESERAARMFADVVSEGGQTVKVDIVVDAGLTDETCICEWDYGVIESNLRVQLAGLKEALSNGAAWAVQLVASEREAAGRGREG